MKYTLDKAIDDIQLLVARMRTRENAVDALRQQITKIQARLLSMRQYQEEVLTFSEFSDRLSTHPKGQLILCLSAENKQLEQLRIENKALSQSLEEHQAALDIIMSKYRGQVAKLMRANRVEELLQSPSPSSGPTLHPPVLDMPNGNARSTSPLANGLPEPMGALPTGTYTAELVNGADKEHSKTANPSSSSTGDLSNNSQSNLLTTRMAALAAIAKDVSDQGDAYANELEEEVHRLRSENAGLREMLMISSNCGVDLGVDDNLGTGEAGTPRDSTGLSVGSNKLDGTLPSPPQLDDPDSFSPDTSLRGQLRHGESIPRDSFLGELHEYGQYSRKSPRFSDSGEPLTEEDEDEDVLTVGDNSDDVDVELACAKRMSKFMPTM